MDLAAARDFVYANARVLEQRLWAVQFDDESPDAVVAAVMAYQNPDGGFGHGLEPDTRCPASQPLDVEIAFERLVHAGADVGPIGVAACDWLASLATPNGAVPILLPSIADYPRADHWTLTDYPPGVNPTGGIVAHAHSLGIAHPWVDRATEYCFTELETGRAPAEAHALRGLSKLCESAPDRARAAAGASSIAAALTTAAFMRLDPADDAYGLTPLDFARTPDSIMRSQFDDNAIDGHLDQLAEDQQDDGGWPVAWAPPSEASRLEWRGIRTVEAVSVLVAYGRLIV